MKALSGFLLIALSLLSFDAVAAAVATTAGNNLTAYNPSGYISNNNWNNLMNSRSYMTSANAPTADFGNCNAVILRCAQPKCAGGGCTSMDLARTIVSGCVQSNESCKEYGDDLIEYISAQLVADSNAKANQAALEAQTAAAQAAQQQSAQQIQAMQTQMQQMQAQMQQQNAEANAQLQAALQQQQEITAQAIADMAAQSASATSSNSAVTVTPEVQQVAVESGVSADVLARQQISGQVLSSLENAEVALKELKAVLTDVYDYAGCDSSGNNCSGPKRVKMFKQKAMNFFEPYNAVLDELYDALILAQSVGVDITDIYMMLNGSCNAWAQYLCGPGQVMHYTQTNCPNGKSVPVANPGETGHVMGGANCTVGQVVPMSDGGCQLVKMLTNNEEVEKSWLYPDIGSDGNTQIRVGCASEILDNSNLFRNRKKQASIDIETLQRIIEQDAPSVYGNSLFGGNTTPESDGIIYCAVNAESFAELQKSAALKRLPDDVCVPQNRLSYLALKGASLASAEEDYDVNSLCSGLFGDSRTECMCNNSIDKSFAKWNASTKTCECTLSNYNIFDEDTARCVDYDGRTRPSESLYDYESNNLLQTVIEDEKKIACEDYESNGAVWRNGRCDCSNVSGALKSLCELFTTD